MAYLKQGEKLMLLVKRDNRTTEEIAAALKLDKSYLPKLYKMDVLPPKPLRKAMAVFGVTENYFTENEEKTAVVAEPNAPYGLSPEGERKRLLDEVTALREEIGRLSKMLEQEKEVNAKLTEAIVNLSKRS